MIKKKIIILGSTGSIGKQTLSIIKKNKKKFCIKLLSTNKNFTKVIEQAKEFNVKRVIISDNDSYQTARLKHKKLGITFYNNFNVLSKIFKKKEIDYSMIAIVGIDGLKPSLEMIKFTKKITIANKESLICGWNLLNKEIKKNNTFFIPADSEHFSIYSLLNKNKDKKMIDKLYITASGGPFVNLSKSKFNKITLEQTIKHPNWSMGKKISIDSATMMNKVFEVIEAKNIFNIPYKKIKILLHQKSYLHAIVKMSNGITKLLIHDTSMIIPIHNSIYSDILKPINSKQLNLSILNNLNLQEIDKKKFPVVKLLDTFQNKPSLYETVLVVLNDYFVKKFIEKKINFNKLIKLIIKYALYKDFTRFKGKYPKNVDEIYKLKEYVTSTLNDIKNYY
jgi:1-deoxy-D-xylulose-5-phosphate reductoisomerase